MSPTIFPQWCASEMQRRADENSIKLMRHDFYRSKKSHSMLPQSNINMCSENKRLISHLHKRRYENQSTLSRSKNKIVNANNIYDERDAQLNNYHCNNVLKTKNITVMKNCREKQLASGSSDCVLKNHNNAKNTMDQLKFNEQFNSMKPINRTQNKKQFNPLNCINYHVHKNGGFHHFWQAAIIIFIGLICMSSADPCAVGLKTPGRTLPAGDIVLEYGQPLQIQCVLNKTFTDSAFPGKNASNLEFFHRDKKMEPEYIKILNETAIEFNVEKPPPMRDMYYCKLRLDENYTEPYEAVCLNTVVVGFRPQMPNNFSCTSYNWENLLCSWTPVENYIDTRISIMFKMPGRSSSRKGYGCPQANHELATPNTCLWDTSTNPIYRQPHEFYNFYINVENVLDNVTFQYRFHHFAHVIPAKPANLTIVNKTIESALLYWNVEFPMKNFPPGLHHRIAYQHQWDTEKTWRIINITKDVHAHKLYYNLTGLEHANTLYDVRVFMRSAVAETENTWSNFSDATFRSLPRLPGRSARTDIGSFEIMENKVDRDLYLYWQAIPLHLENGDHFEYHFDYVEENGRVIFIRPNETTRTYAKFKGVSHKSYRFVLSTTNVVGTHPEKASIYIPSRAELPSEPLAFTKIAFNDGLYELSWKPPIRNKKITNYTIFWCDNDRDRPYQCAGYLDWIHIAKTRTMYNITVPDPRKVYQFAISANTPSGSSGMVWASCTVIHRGVIGKMKSVWINQRGSNNISVSWKLDCSDRIGNVEAFNIYYCPIISPRNLKCKDPKQRITIPAGPQTTSGVVTGLKPYTTYMINVAVVTKRAEGLHSDPLHDTTFEAAPTTPPLNVTVSNVTNTTMFVSWVSPTAMNGVLRYYEVHYSGNSIKVEESTHVLLKDLLPFKNYSIRVAACTVECSAQSPVIYHFTDIGKPGKMAKTPTVRFINSTHMIIMWNKPFNFGGNLDYYQISSGKGEIQNSTKMEIQLPIPDCKAEDHRQVYYFQVRAVNVDHYGNHFIGPWSDAGENNCYSDGSSIRIYIIIWVICGLSGLIFVCLLAYSSKRMWFKCIVMKNIDVKVPQGMAPHEKLLQKIAGTKHLRQSSADSSHCSSGQESVTSSLTSDSNVSADSGADVDPITISQNKLLESSTTWETSSLRQRNVGTIRPEMMPDSLRWDPYAKGAKPGEIIDDTMLLARSTPNLTDNSDFMMPQQAWSSTGYISMPSSEELSSNPSPVPSNTEHIDNYSVVGVIPNISRSTVEESSESSDKPLLTSPNSKVNAPYVTLASLEQQNLTKSIDPLHNLNKLTFVPLDHSSMSYIQTGLMDNMRKSFGMNSPAEMKKADSLQSQNASTSNLGSESGFVPSLVSNPNQLKSIVNDTKSKPYVTVGSIPEIIMSSKLPTRISDDQHQDTGLDTSHKPYVQASTVFQVFKHKENQDNDKLCTDDDRMDKASTSPCSIYWQSDDTESSTLPELVKSDVASKVQSTPNYTMSTETLEIDDKITEKKISPYVQHQRLEQHLALTGTSLTDEQYSKVAVAPHTKMP